MGAVGYPVGVAGTVSFTHEDLSPDVRIYLGDCLEVLPTIATEAVDCVVTDPPYGNGTEYASYIDSSANLCELARSCWPMIAPIPRIAITCGVANIHKWPEPRWILSWANPAGMGSGPWGFCCWQPILVYGKDPYLQDGKGRRPDTLFQRMNQVADVDHPCAKPDNVMRWIVERTTRKQETVLDPFMGSGTTGVACAQLGRRFLGIEICQTYYDIARKRISDALLQGRLL